MKKIIAFFLSGNLLLSGCTADPAKDAQDALSLALESNLKYREIHSECATGPGAKYIGDFSPLRKKLVSKVVIIPINKEVIDAKTRLQSARQKLSSQTEADVRKQNYATFLNSDQITFIMIVINNANLEYGKDRIYIDQPLENVFATSRNQSYKLIDYTTSLGTNLNPGWNDGYLRFKNFRKKQGSIDDYSLHIKSMTLTCDNTDNTATQQWAFSFDDSDMNYLKLIQEGLTKDQVREKYNLNAFTYLQMDANDIANVVKLVSKFIP